MAWTRGPMPAGTYGWGGVVPAGMNAEGFLFADFCGDYVRLADGSEDCLGPDDIEWYDNSLTLPPFTPGAGKRHRGVPPATT